MTDYGWRARVETLDREVIGAGFLVDGSRVVTCAHVVQGHERVQVVFPGLTEELPATVVACTDWAQAGDAGDVAVLGLDAPVDIEPVVFAPVDALRRRAVTELGAYGFPWHKDDSGSVVELRTRRDMDLRREWWQLNVPDAHLETLEHGFSGAAVYLAETGEVVGMATDRDKRLDGAGGRMLPLTSIRRYVEDLDDLLDLDWPIPSEPRRELRRILRGVPPDLAMNDLHRQAFPAALAVRPLRSVWDAVRYVAEEHCETEALGVFLTRLLPHLEPPVRERLAAWRRRHLPDVERTPVDGPTSLIVRLDRMTRGGTYELTVLSVVDGESGPSAGPVEVREEEIRGRVEECLQRVWSDRLRDDVIIEFALPTSLFDTPFDTWSIAGSSLRLFPVVLRYAELMNPAAVQRHLTLRRWQRLRDRRRTAPEPVGCALPWDDREFQNWLEVDDDVAALTYAASPSKGRLNAARNAGIPVMLWPRTTCGSDTHDGDCAGGRKLGRLSAAVADLHPDELPAVVMRLRRKAWHPNADREHIGRDLALVWDDPARLPDPPLAMGV